MAEVAKFYIFLIYIGFIGRVLGIGFQGGRLFLILIASLLTSYLSFLNLAPLNGIVFFLIASLPIIYIIKKGKPKKVEKYEVLSEIIFLVLFIFSISIRMYSSSIFGAEKPMEYAFITSIARTVHLPPYDPWLIGYLNPYYYFGFIPIALISKLLSIPNPYMFNIFNCFIFAISGAIAFEILYRIKRQILPGVLGTIIIMLMANYERVFALIKHKALVNYWASSRVIANTINEFPFFSFIHGDNHPHYLFLPLSILGVYLIWKENKPFLLLFNIFIFIINPWSAPFFFFLWFAKKFIENGFKLDDLADIAIYYLGALILSLPFLYTRGHTPLGIGIVPRGSNPLELFIHWGPFFLLTFIIFRKKDMDIFKEYIKKYWYIGILAIGAIIFRPSLFLGVFTLLIYILAKKEKDKERKFFLTVLAYAYLVITGCEIVFIRDIYAGGAFYRGNTVFKFYYLSWILFGISLSYLIFTRKEKLIKVIALLIIIPGFLYLPYSIKARIDMHNPPTLNGIAFIERYHPIDYKIISYLNKNVKGHPGIVEAMGKGSYTYYGRISTYTGLPTIMGWNMHELVWRGYIPEGEQRAKAIDTIYTKDMNEKEKVIKRYKIRYMIIGELERKKYGEKLVLPYSKDDIKVKKIEKGKGIIFEFTY